MCITWGEGAAYPRGSGKLRVIHGKEAFRHAQALSSGRDPKSVRLCAVCKTRTVQEVMASAPDRGAADDL